MHCGYTPARPYKQQISLELVQDAVESMGFTLLSMPWCGLNKSVHKRNFLLQIATPFTATTLQVGGSMGREVTLIPLLG